MIWIDWMVTIVFGGVAVVFIGGIIYRIIHSLISKKIVVKATVLDKYSAVKNVYDIVNRRGFKDEAYYVVCFDINGRTKKFSVDILAYDYLEKGRTGTLKYKDDKFISFD